MHNQLTSPRSQPQRAVNLFLQGNNLSKTCAQSVDKQAQKSVDDYTQVLPQGVNNLLVHKVSHFYLHSFARLFLVSPHHLPTLNFSKFNLFGSGFYPVSTVPTITTITYI